MGHAATVSSSVFVCLLLVGASALAVWTYARFPGRAPSTFGWAVVHLVLSGIAAELALPRALGSVAPVESKLTALAVLGVSLPALTYMMLASLWLLSLARRMLGGYAP
jgi:hypothetical protein